MIHEEICTYEAFYYNDGFLQYAKFENWNGRYINKFSAPTQSLLQRWLREEKNLYISIIAHAKSKRVYYEWEVRYISALGNMNKASSAMSIEIYRYNTYELALEDALKYTLENLV